MHVTRDDAPIVPSLTRVVDADERQAYWERLCALWNLPKRTRHFPGAHPVPVDAKNVARLQRGKYVVALKTDGIRHILFLTTQLHSDEPIALMIDRALVMYEVSVWANYEFFERGTLLEGELAWNVVDGFSNHTLSFCVFDAIAVAGKHIASNPFSDRLQVIHESLFRPWKVMSDAELETHVQDENKIICRQRDPYSITFTPKACHPCATARDVWNARAASLQRTDGLLFTCGDSPMAFGRTESILKWKPRHTIDVAIKRSRDDAFSAWVDTAQSRTAASTRRKTAEVVALELRLDEVVGKAVVLDAGNVLMQSLPAEARAVFECEVHSSDAKTLALFPIRRRDDKRDTNSAATITSTIALSDVDVEFLSTRLRQIPR